MTVPRSHLHVLVVLAAGDSHGYGIMAEADELTGGRAGLGPGSLYAALGRLIDLGLIIETDERPSPELDDARRRYYRITTQGRAVLAEELARLDRIVAYARSNNVAWTT
ncbi:MAG: PadR family transcriptional regulator [Acidimicrobiales bacterium]